MKTVLKLLAALMVPFAAAATAALIPAQGQAQSQSQDRPRIGLVLAGGGAAGVAHVGVIRELERMGLRPDLITGTSMGSIVGGLYAAGYTPDDLERVVTEIDWSTILNDQSDRQLTHPQRRDSRIDPLSVQADLPLKLGPEGVLASAGLVDGVKLSLILRELTVPARRIRNFDNLPIPFRAVATDLATGLPVVLGQGDLEDALRASMSIPALLPPVKLEGKVLVDGGVANNLPIDVARDLGADIVIASFIPPAKVDASSLDTFTGSLAQTMSIFIHARSREQIAQLGPNDVLLEPDVGSVGMLDFNAAPETIVKGVAAVGEKLSDLQALASLRQRPEQWEPVGPTSELKVVYSGIDVEYDGILDPRIIRRRLGLPESGAATAKELEIAVRRVYGLDLFENVSYRLRRDGDTDRLVIVASSRSAGALEPRVGLNLINSFGGDSDFNLAIGATLPELTPMGARLDIDGLIGSIEGVRVRFEQPLDLDHEFFSLIDGSYVRSSGTLFARPDVPSSQVEITQALLELNTFWAPGDWGRVGIGVGFERTVAETSLGELTGTALDRVDEDRLPVSLLLDIDTLDDPDLPRDGAQISAALSYDTLGSENIGDVTVDALYAHSFGQHTLSPFVFLEAELQNEEFAPHFIGGFQQLSGFDELELVGNVVGVAGLRYYRRFGFDSPFGSEAFVGGSLEYGGAYADWGDLGGDGSFVAGSLFAGVQTPFGPLIIAYGTAEGGQHAGTLTLGTRF